MLKTPICPTCGCSLVRLGIPKDKAVPISLGGEPHLFCCRGCVDLFTEDPQSYLQETKDLIVCPTCLAEKPSQQAVELTVAGEKVHFCRCPHCVEAFQKMKEYFGYGYTKLLEDAYEKARGLHSAAFDETELDWVFATSDKALSNAIEWAMYQLSRYDFTTVKGANALRSCVK